jgi:hypothetical protein
MKSGATVGSDALDVLRRALAEEAGSSARLVHGGTDMGIRTGVELRPWSSLDDAAWTG